MGTSVFSVPSFLLPLREHEPFIKSSLQEHIYTHKCSKSGPERIPSDGTFIRNTKLCWRNHPEFGIAIWLNHNKHSFQFAILIGLTNPCKEYEFVLILIGNTNPHSELQFVSIFCALVFITFRGTWSVHQITFTGTHTHTQVFKRWTRKKPRNSSDQGPAVLGLNFLSRFIRYYW